MNLPTKIFNTTKTYGNDQLFFGNDPGLFDSINVKYPAIDDLYRSIKMADWSRDEFDYKDSHKDFATVDKSFYESMLFTLVFQTAADSVASRSIAPVLQQAITNSELNAAICALQAHEELHADSYSFAIRNCFDDPQGVIKEAEKLVEAHLRLSTVAKVFDEARVASFSYALGQISKEDAYPKILNMIVALYCLEAIQFINSFAITGAFWETNLFKAVGDMVRLIMRDEQLHARLDKTVLDIELKTAQGRKWMSENQNQIKNIIDEVVASEIEWTNFIFSEGRQVPGLNFDIVTKYIHFIAQGVYDTLKIKTDFSRVKENPLPYMNRFADLNSIQASPQEQADRGAAYLIGGIVNDGADDFEMEI